MIAPRKTILSPLIAAMVFLTCCSPVLADSVHISQWRSIAEGIDCATGESNSPRMQKTYAVRVDLANPNIEIFSTPDNGDEPLMTSGQTTSEFLKMYGCAVAVNANSFSPVDQTRPRNVYGLAISKGKIIAPPNAKYPSLLITKSDQVRIAEVNETADLKNVWTAVSGFGIILSDGNNVGDSKTIHPRTAAGLSRDNHYLFLMVIDGRQAGYSEGATLYETAEWLKSFGAYNGLNLDGGGSSSLVRSDGSGGAIILNRPIHLGIVGKERIVGNNLGVLITSKKQTDKN
jgi:hypothetical protein